MKKLLIGCFGLVALLTIGAIIGVVMMPNKFKVQRTHQVSGTPEEAYAVVANLHTWPDWTSWSREKDASCVWDWTGPESGAGAVMSWKGDVHKEGVLTLTHCVPGKEVAYDVVFIEDGAETTSQASLTFQAVGDKTEVVWTMSGDMAGIWKLMIPVMDILIGPMFDEGLQGLDKQLSAGAAPSDPAQQPAKEG
jgi:hypothetical protein